MELKILEPIKHYLKEFNTPEEFNIFYLNNKEELDSQTTHKLNKKYHVLGYRITKIKGVLMLKKWNDKKVKEEEEVTVDYTEEFDEIKDQIQKIKSTMNEIISWINTHDRM